MSQQRVLVTGATGRTGQLIVQKLHHTTWIVRVLVRDEQQAAPFREQGYEISFGDVRDNTTSWADPAMRDVHTVLSAMGGVPFRANNLWRVDYEGTQRLIAAAKVAHVQHYIFISTMGLRRQRSVFQPLSMLFYPKLLAEDVIRRSGLDYTIIRPGGLVEHADAGMRNTREQVAEACLVALERTDSRNQTWEMSVERRHQHGADPILGVAVNPDAA